ncbi:hypothetical protein [Spirillospora sp. NPDC047279]|uniref:SCO7613 C-terminal domain-containing membrane protein n=1 Tax=Spirillospora sp. NPDC047279 TaxID=3155478 RepID=UPI00340C1322
MTRPMAACPVCEITLVGPAARELWWVDDQLTRLGHRRRDLLALLYAPPVHYAGAAQQAGPVPAAEVRVWPRERGDVSGFGVRNALLALGGVLLGIAAVAFTVISWGSLGMGVRALILTSITGVALGSVWPLARRGLSATAETLAVVGLLLIGLEFYAAYAADLLGLRSVDAWGYAAWAAAAATVLWGAYASVAPLRLARPLAVVIGQLPLPLAAVAFDAPVSGMACTLLVLALLDLGVWWALPGVRRVTTMMAAVAWASGSLVALVMAFTISSPQSGALLLLASGVALAWAVLVASPVMVAAGFTACVGATAAFPLHDRWEPAVTAVFALALLGASRPPLPERLRTPLPERLRKPGSLGAVAAMGLAVLLVAPGTVYALFSPARHLGEVWAGTSVELAPGEADLLLPSGPIVLALLAVALCLIARVAAPPVVALAVLTVPDLPYPLPPASMVAIATVLAAWAAFGREIPDVRVAAGLTAVASAGWAAAEALATERATLGVLGAVVVLAAACTFVRALRSGAAATAAVALGAFAAAAGLAMDLDVHEAAFGVLAAGALGTAVAAWLREVPAEIAAWGVVAGGLGMAATRPLALSLALALAGAPAFAVALRGDRRPAVWAGSALTVMAWWVLLGAGEITAPEPYSLPVSALLLGIGFLHRRGRALSSWVAYGPGLAVTLVPSLMVAWTAEPGAARPLILAAAALVITLVGARARLQAPLILGGAVLVLDVAHQVAPYATEVIVRLPGWFPVAVAGLAVLALGATYEHRLRDLRRLRDAVTRLG